MNSVARITQDATDGAPVAAALAAGAHLIPIDLIDIPPERSRGLDEDWVEVLADLMADAGLINPITVREVDEGRFRLVTGLHRISAALVLGWAAIPCRFSSADSDDAAKLEEVVENLGRNELNALDRAHHLYDLKEVYERHHPEVKNGGDRRSEMAKKQNAIFAFCSIATDKTGLSRRSVELSISIWKGLSVASRQRCTGTWLASHQSSLQALSQLGHPVQAKVLAILLADKPKATTVADALVVIGDGRLPTHVEKKFATINKTLAALKDGELEAVLAVNADRIASALDRMPARAERRVVELQETFSALEDSAFETVVEAHADRIIETLKRMGRI